jgi:hypothetical protein
MHARKKNASLIRSRSLTMEIIKIFTLKQNDSSPVLVNNITFAAEHMDAAAGAVGAELVGHLEALVQMLHVLQETKWTSSRQQQAQDDLVGWREVAIAPASTPVPVPDPAPATTPVPGPVPESPLQQHQSSTAQVAVGLLPGENVNSMFLPDLSIVAIHTAETEGCKK